MKEVLRTTGGLKESLEKRRRVRVRSSIIHYWNRISEGEAPIKLSNLIGGVRYKLSLITIPQEANGHV